MRKPTVQKSKEQRQLDADWKAIQDKWAIVPSFASRPVGTSLKTKRPK